MKKTGYILFILWLSTVVVSNALMVRNSFFDTSSIELTEKESKEKSTDDSNDESEKESKKESEKAFLIPKNARLLFALNTDRLSNLVKISAQDEDCASSLYVFLRENPPKI